MSVDLNLAGTVHGHLSRNTLVRKRKAVEAEDAYVSTRGQSFTQRVAKDALQGAMIARTVALPMTRTTDFFLGTSTRESIGHSAEKFGLVWFPGIMVGMVGYAAGGLAGALVGKPARVARVTGRAAFFGVSQPASLVGAVPKAVASGIGIAAGGAVGVMHGLYDVLTHDSPVDAHASGALRNDQTFALEPLADVPKKYFFRSCDGWGFDIRELAEFMRQSNDYLNPHTQPLEPFEQVDIERFVRHPSQVGRHVYETFKVTKSVNEVSAATKQQLQTLLRGLQRDWRNIEGDRAQRAVTIAHGTPEQVAAIANFSAYLDALPGNELDALKNATQRPTGENLVDYYRRVAAGYECMAGFRRVLERMIEALER